MREDYEALLRAGLYRPPADFADCVMARLEAPEPAARARPRGERIQWLALIGASLLGAMQLAAFMFGIWSATSAG
jgi:hypothetical protein